MGIENLFGANIFMLKEAPLQASITLSCKVPSVTHIRDEGFIVRILSELLLVSRTVKAVRSASRSDTIWLVAQAVQVTILSDFYQHLSMTLG